MGRVVASEAKVFQAKVVTLAKAEVALEVDLACPSCGPKLFGKVQTVGLPVSKKRNMVLQTTPNLACQHSS